MPVIKVFYSWQSDSPPETGKALVRAALGEAVRRLMVDATVELRPEIDEDTTGIPGSPNIVQQIFRKIDGSGVFVADTTLTYERGQEDGRRAPNPNVLLELGYALKRLGWERVLQVINTAYGNPEALPFDLRGHRAVTYDAADGSKASAQEGLIHDLEENLRLILSELGLPGDLAAPVRLKLGYRNRRITSARHEYRLSVTATNTGSDVIEGWAVEIRLPRDVLEPTLDYPIIEASSSQDEVVMRWTELEHTGPIYPNDTREVVGLDYFMDHDLHRRSLHLFPQPVRATFFIGGSRVAFVEKLFRELQIF